MDCEQLKSSMMGWFGAEFECQPSGHNSLTATIPVLKPNGDYIEIGVEHPSDEVWLLSDLGDTYASLYLAGVDLSEKYSRGEEFRQIVKAYHIQNHDQELTLKVNSSELASGVFDLIQAIQSMLALQYTVRLRQPNRDFASVVSKFLAESRTSFEVPSQHIQGKTGRWKFNFVLRKPSESMALVKTLTATTNGEAVRAAKQSVFEFQDVSENLPLEMERLVILDDEEGREELWDSQAKKVLGGYRIQAVQFSKERERLLRIVHRFAA